MIAELAQAGRWNPPLWICPVVARYFRLPMIDPLARFTAWGGVRQ